MLKVYNPAYLDHLVGQFPFLHQNPPGHYLQYLFFKSPRTIYLLGPLIGKNSATE